MLQTASESQHHASHHDLKLLHVAVADTAAAAAAPSPPPPPLLLPPAPAAAAARSLPPSPPPPPAAGAAASGEAGNHAAAAAVVVCSAAFAVAAACASRAFHIGYTVVVLARCGQMVVRIACFRPLATITGLKRRVLARRVQATIATVTVGVVVRAVILVFAAPIDIGGPAATTRAKKNELRPSRHPLRLT